MDITLGIEEELMIIDPATREVITDPPPEIFEHARRNAKPHNVVNELLRAQIETNSKICRSIEELDTSLRETRAAVIEAARSEGASVIASSTHPWARWQDQRVTRSSRYQRAEAVLQDSVRQFFIGGMHVHAGFATPDIRIAAMNAIVRHLRAAARAIDLVTLPWRSAHRVEVVPAKRDRCGPAHRAAANAAQLGGVRADCAHVQADRRNRRRKRAALGHPALGTLPDHRASDLRHLPEGGGRNRDRRALGVPHSTGGNGHRERSPAGEREPRGGQRRPLARATVRNLRVPARRPGTRNGE